MDDECVLSVVLGDIILLEEPLNRSEKVETVGGMELSWNVTEIHFLLVSVMVQQVMKKARVDLMP